MRRLYASGLMTAACAAGLIVFAYRLDGWKLVALVMGTVWVASWFSAEVDAYGDALDAAPVAQTTKGADRSAPPV